jgi:hypothetical protein
MMLTGLVPMHDLGRFERLQQHPQPAHPRFSAQSPVWRHEHAPVDPSDGRFGVAETHPASLSRRVG